MSLAVIPCPSLSPIPLIPLLAQETAPAEPATGWFGFEDVFWITILVIFVLAIVGALLRLRQRDKCLKMLHDYHVTYLGGQALTIWGDLRVVNRGIELIFDAPYRNRRGLIKRSTLIYEDEYKTCVAITRSPHGLTEKEREERDRQIRGTFDPGILRRSWRWLRNIVNTIRDAFAKTMTMFTGQLTKTGKPSAAAVASQKGHVDQISETLIGFVGNAYEALLERHVGKPVILEFRNPAGGAPLFEMPGYLVDYSDQFVAVFNADYHTTAQLTVKASGESTHEAVKLEREANHVLITCEGPDAIVVRRMTCGGTSRDLAVALVAGCAVRLPCDSEEDPDIDIEVTRTVDIVCPRAVARVRFGGGRIGPGEEAGEERRENWSGIAPDIERTLESETSESAGMRTVPLAE